MWETTRDLSKGEVIRGQWQSGSHTTQSGPSQALCSQETSALSHTSANLSIL